jgi:hypothetical protein
MHKISIALIFLLVSLHIVVAEYSQRYLENSIRKMSHFGQCRIVFGIVEREERPVKKRVKLEV